MGVNMAGNAIVDDEVCCEASRQEIIRRYYASACAVRKGKVDGSETQKLEVLMRSSGIAPQMRRTVPAALDRAAETGGPATAIELEDGTVVTGKTSELLGAQRGGAAECSQDPGQDQSRDQAHLAKRPGADPGAEDGAPGAAGTRGCIRTRC